MADAAMAESTAPQGPLSVAEATSLLLAQEAPANTDKASPAAAPAEAKAPAPKAPEPRGDDVNPTEAIADLLGLSDDSPDDSDQEPAEESDEQTRYRVKAGDSEIEVTLEELTRGYQRQSDYTRKTQELSEQRKTAEEQQGNFAQMEQQLAQDREQLQTRLGQLNETLTQTVAQEPTQQYWDQLYQSDEGEWARQKILWQETKSRHVEVQAEAQYEQERLHTHYQQQLAARRSQEEVKMLERIPAWKNTKTRTSEMGGIVDHLKGKGFSESEILSEMDSRVVDMARDAWLLSEIRSQVSKARTKVDAGPKPLGRTRATGQRSSSKETERLTDTLKKSGTVADAVALLRARSK